MYVCMQCNVLSLIVKDDLNTVNMKTWVHRYIYIIMILYTIIILDRMNI